MVHPSVPAKSIAELIAHAKANPKALNYPAGNTYALVATALFAANNGIVMHAVPYKSEPDAMPDLLSGRVHLLFGTSTSVGGAREGRQAARARHDAQRAQPVDARRAFVPGGGPGRSSRSARGSGWSAPAGLPREIVVRMNKEMVAVLGKPSVKERC